MIYDHLKKSKKDLWLQYYSIQHTTIQSAVINTHAAPTLAFSQLYNRPSNLMRDRIRLSFTIQDNPSTLLCHSRLSLGFLQPGSQIACTFLSSIAAFFFEYALLSLCFQNLLPTTDFLVFVFFIFTLLFVLSLWVSLLGSM